MSQNPLTTTAASLRAAFDRTFSEPPRADIDALDAFLAVHIGGDPYALRLDEIAGLQVDRKVVPLPTSTPSLLGIVAVGSDVDTRGGVRVGSVLLAEMTIAGE